MVARGAGARRAPFRARRGEREQLAARGLRAPSEAKLVEMLKQLTGRGSNTLIAHDGVQLRVYRGDVKIERPIAARAFHPVTWHGERRLALPELGGELRFRRARGAGIDPK